MITQAILMNPQILNFNYLRSCSIMFCFDCRVSKSCSNIGSHICFLNNSLCCIQIFFKLPQTRARTSAASVLQGVTNSTEHPGHRQGRCDMVRVLHLVLRANGPAPGDHSADHSVLWVGPSWRWLETLACQVGIICVMQVEPPRHLHLMTRLNLYVAFCFFKGNML